jgi:hypothetical protein
MLEGQKSPFEWQEFSIGSPALTLETPGVPYPQEVPLPNDVLSFIRRYDAYIIENEAKGIAVIISHVAYADEIKADLKGALEGTIAEWELNGSKVDILSTSEQMFSGKTGIRQSGLLYLETGLFNYTNTVIVEGSMLWQILVVIQTEDMTLQLVLQKILDSITFKDLKK